MRNTDSFLQRWRVTGSDARENNPPSNMPHSLAWLGIYNSPEVSQSAYYILAFCLSCTCTSTIHSIYGCFLLLNQLCLSLVPFILALCGAWRTYFDLNLSIKPCSGLRALFTSMYKMIATMLHSLFGTCRVRVSKWRRLYNRIPRWCSQQGSINGWTGLEIFWASAASNALSLSYFLWCYMFRVTDIISNGPSNDPLVSVPMTCSDSGRSSMIFISLEFRTKETTKLQDIYISKPRQLV